MDVIRLAIGMVILGLCFARLYSEYSAYLRTLDYHKWSLVNIEVALCILITVVVI